MHAGVEKVAAALRERGADGEVVELEDSARTAAEAAAALGVEIGQIVNSLIFADADGDARLILTSGAHRVDTAHVGALIGTTLKRADPDLVREKTGQAIGGVAPVGHPAPVRTYVDVALQQYEVVWAAAGHPHAVFPTTYDELVRITGGEPVSVEP
ncbi:MAG TPA: YbaK/EbsC family protein [Mycobacteriales bacterium]|nr:YbaK/EbsC family protein [Mycobacteriales bacterium]